MKKILMLISFLFLLSLCSCKTSSVNEYEILAFSTTINVRLYNDSKAKDHYRAIVNLCNKINRVASDYNNGFTDEASIKDLNDNRQINANEILLDMISSSIEISQKTNGYFNPLIGRLSHLWKDAIAQKKILSEEVINNELNIMNTSSLVIDQNNIQIIGDANVDLGAFAKGYATQKIADYLNDNDVKYYLINSGNSNIAFSSKLKADFKVGINKAYSNGYYGYIKGQNLAIGTSAGTHQYFKENGTIYHHVINPMTGYPANSCESLTVVCNDSTLADVYSTALMCMDSNIRSDYASKNNLKYIACNSSEITEKCLGDLLCEK